MSFRRFNKLSLPGLQLRWISSFPRLSLLALLFQLALLANTFARLASELPNDKELALQASTSALARGFLLSAVVALPATLVVGAFVTNRLAGPVYRLCNHLRAVRSGEAQGPCLLRKGDHLHELCEEINATVEALRTESGRRADAA